MATKPASVTACQNSCGSKDTSCRAGARAFRKGVHLKPGTEWFVCRACRFKANDVQRTYSKLGQSWEGKA